MAAYASFHRSNTAQVTTVADKTRSSAVAERLRDSPCRWRFCWVTEDHSRSFEITPL